MKINLVAEDAELEKLCRNILSETVEVSCPWTLSLTDPRGAWEEADIHIVDFDPDVPLSRSATCNPLGRLFLVFPKDLPVFRQRTGLEEANVLLKPVVRATLTDFLVSAVSSGALQPIRTDRDEILQC